MVDVHGKTRARVTAASLVGEGDVNGISFDDAVAGCG
jgi:hypothetical protein